MIKEIAYVVDFITAFIYQSNLTIPYFKIKAFKISLTSILVQNYANYWDENNPNKYKNLRSVRFNYYIDSLVMKAWTNINVGLPTKVAKLIFPMDLVIYCDPWSVTYARKDKKFILYKCFDSHI